MARDRDDLALLKAEREEADRAYNEALTRLDAAIQQLPADFPHPPPGPDETQVTRLNESWTLAMPAAPGGLRGQVASGVLDLLAPVFERQQAFNAALVDHINRNIPVERQTRESIASTLTVLRDHLADSARFQSLVVIFVQQITPYVDTRDRDVAGLLRGLSSAISGVADEMMKRTEALLVRDERRADDATRLAAQLADLEAKLAALAAVRASTTDSSRG